MPNDFSKATLGRDVSGERPRYMNISPLRKVGKPSVCWMQYILPGVAVIKGPAEIIDIILVSELDGICP